MAQKPLSVLISGAGVAGCSMALMLARHPAFKVKPMVTLIERSPSRRTTGQAIDIRGPAVDVIRTIGLEPEIKARHTSETGMMFINTQGAEIAKFAATGDARRQAMTSEYEILRGELVGLLLDHMQRAKEQGSHVNSVDGEYIESMEEQEGGVDVTFAKGKLQDGRFDVVVGADGITSRTRVLMFGEENQADVIKPTGLYVALFTVPRIATDDEIYRWCVMTQGRSIHLRPHRNKETMGVYLCKTNSKKVGIPELDAILKKDIAAQKDYLKQEFKDAGWQSQRMLDALEQADDYYMTHWCASRTPQWSKGRCVILGDAAFATRGVGTSLAMVGAYTIAGELSKITSSKDVPTALQSYETTFRPFVKQHEFSPPGIPQLMNPQTALGVNILQNSMKAAATLKISNLVMKFAGGQEKNGWKLPEYGWQTAHLA